MTCAICSYEWCWVCGLSYHSMFHYGQAGGLVCEMIGGVFFAKKSACWKITMFLLIFIGMPFIVIFFFVILGLALVFYVSTLLKINKSFHACSRADDKLSMKLKRLPNPFSCIVFTTFKVLFWLLMAAFWISFCLLCIVLGLAIGAALSVLMIIPFYIAFLIVLCRKNVVWNQSKPAN